MNRDIKRVVILIVYLLVLFFFVYGIWYILKPKPTCFDAIQNQDEVGVDCGGACEACEEEIMAEDIEILSKDAVYGGEGLYDVLIKVSNPNSEFGSSEFGYVIYLKDDQGKVLAEKSGTSYILPRETKYVIETNLESNVNPSQVYIELDSNIWEKVDIFEEPELNVYNKQY
ncbi:hypothetical protein ACFL08_05955, partial [Patescibacteria group bacterium]